MTTNQHDRSRRSMPWRDIAIGFAVGLATASVVALWVLWDDGGRPADGSFDSPANESSASRLERLAHDLATEIETRRKLSERIARLEARLDTIAALEGELPTGTAENRASSEGDPDVDAHAATEGDTEGSIDGEGKAVFDVDALLALGVHPRDIDRLRELWASHALDRAAINDRAMREGWFMQPRHGAELAMLEREFREELGDDEDYDQYLYAVGQPNRLVAREVLAGSSASEAGLRQGDTILRYDGERVFTTGDLLRASSEGEPGRRVPVTVLRDDRRTTLSVRTGPLGVIITQRSAPPLAD